MGLYSRIVGAADTTGTKTRERHNGIVHLSALTLTKIADGVIEPKLVLAWLMSALGAPAGMVGLLVPIREALALFPQLFLAAVIPATHGRRIYWAAGSLAQGVFAIAIALSAFRLEGIQAGLAILGALAGLAMARSICSLTYKDALARSIPQSRRGSVTGAAASLAATGILIFSGLLAIGLIPTKTGSITLVIMVAGGLWLTGGLIFLSLSERQADNGDDSAPGLGTMVAALRDNGQLRLFIACRSLLCATALAPPFLLMASAKQDGQQLGTLGPMMVAVAGASILSSYVWGRLSDRSSRRTLIWSALGGAMMLGAAALCYGVTDGLGGVVVAPVFVFGAQIAYEGVRAGRKIHLTDMSDDATRTVNTAVSNSLVGLVLIAGGGLGFIADSAGLAVTLACLAALCFLAVPLAWGLDEVQRHQT